MALTKKEWMGGLRNDLSELKMLSRQGLIFRNKKRKLKKSEVHCFIKFLIFFYILGYESVSSTHGLSGHFGGEPPGFGIPPNCEANSVFPFPTNLAVMHSKLFSNDSQQQQHQQHHHQQQQHFTPGLSDLSKTLTAGTLITFSLEISG